MPLAGVAKVGQMETIAGGVFEAGEGGIEFPAGVVHKARTVALDESIVGAVPPPVDIDRVVEVRWANLGKGTRLQTLVDEDLARTCERGVVGLKGPPRWRAASPSASRHDCLTICVLGNGCAAQNTAPALVERHASVGGESVMPEHEPLVLPQKEHASASRHQALDLSLGA